MRSNEALKVSRLASVSGARSSTSAIGDRESRLERGKTMLLLFGSISSTVGSALVLELISDAYLAHRGLWYYRTDFFSPGRSGDLFIDKCARVDGRCGFAALGDHRIELRDNVEPVAQRCIKAKGAALPPILLFDFIRYVSRSGMGILQAWERDRELG